MVWIRWQPIWSMGASVSACTRARRLTSRRCNKRYVTPASRCATLPRSRRNRSNEPAASPCRAGTGLDRIRRRRGGADQLQQRAADRKSVVEGKRVSVRVDRGGRRLIKKKKNKK